jgi:ribosomal protein S18 acetylase RimI-like enzyme
MPVVTYSLRPARDADLEQLMRIGHEGLRPYVEALRGWDRTAEERRFREDFDPSAIQVVQVDGRDAGYVRLESRDDHLLLAGIYLGATVRRRGVGSAIVCDLMARCRAERTPLRLQVLFPNPARRLYERLGFRVVRETDTHVHMEASPDAAPAVHEGGAREPAGP